MCRLRSERTLGADYAADASAMRACGLRSDHALGRNGTAARSTVSRDRLRGKHALGRDRLPACSATDPSDTTRKITSDDCLAATSPGERHRARDKTGTCRDRAGGYDSGDAVRSVHRGNSCFKFFLLVGKVGGAIPPQTENCKYFAPR